MAAVWFSIFFKTAFMFSRRFKAKLERVNDGINIKHSQNDDDLYSLMLQQNTKRENNSLL